MEIINSSETVAAAVLGFLLGALVGFVYNYPSDKAKQTLVNNGYKNISMTGYVFFGCDKNDLFRHGFSATSQSGIQVSGAVCGGILKGYTIRFN